MFQGVMSSSETINSSVIQGSANDPVAYLVNASDLRPAHTSNELEKFAEDTYLLVAAAQASLRQLEIDNVETWASNNNLQLNRAKSQEIISGSQGKSWISRYYHLLFLDSQELRP